MIPETPNPAWNCPDCGTRLVRTESGWVCPKMHGGIVGDLLLADRLFRRAAGGTSDEWLLEVERESRRRSCVKRNRK